MNRRIRNLEDEYAKLWQMYGDLENERDRLREALMEARHTLVVAIKAGLDGIDMDVAEHATIKAIDAALQETQNDN